jgi:hypothetical protein
VPEAAVGQTTGEELGQLNQEAFIDSSEHGYWFPSHQNRSGAVQQEVHQLQVISLVCMRIWLFLRFIEVKMSWQPMAKTTPPDLSGCADYCGTACLLSTDCSTMA